MKIIQIAAAAAPDTDNARGLDTLYGLCANGRVVYMDFRREGSEWVLLPEVPDDLFD